MLNATVLLADNDPDFVRARAELLEQRGIRVVAAANPFQARELLDKGGIDLAVLDIRLIDDDDEKDLSGLLLAKEACQSIPKIFLTRFPSVEYVRSALRTQIDGSPLAVGFVDKAEDPEALVEAILNALGLHAG